MMLLLAASFLAVCHATTTGEEFKAIRDDIRGICYKIYGTSEGPKHCREVGQTDTQRHIHHDCWKSGWSGAGKLRCKYGFEMYGTNTQGHGDQEVHPGANGGRRRLQDGLGNPSGSGLAEEEREDIELLPMDSASSSIMTSVTYHFDNFEHVESVERLGEFRHPESICMLQGITAYDDEDVNPNCGVQFDEDGNWVMKMTSASCSAFCTPRRI